MGGHSVTNVALLRPNGGIDRKYKPDAIIGTPWVATIAGDGTVYYAAGSGIGSMDAVGRRNEPRSLPQWWSASHLFMLEDGTLAGSVHDGRNHLDYPYLDRSYWFFNLSGPLADMKRGANNTLYLAGSMSRWVGGTEWRSGIVRTQDGFLDQSFNFSFPGARTDESWSVKAIFVDASDRVLFAAAPTDPDSYQRRDIIGRVLADGTADSTFNAGEGPEGPVGGLLRTRNGHTIVWGAFRTFNGVSRPGLLRLQTE